MFPIVIAIICIIVALIGKKTEKKLFNPVTILLGLWGCILFFSNLRYYTLYSAENKTYLIIFVGLISFFVGYYILRTFLKGNYFVTKRIKTSNSLIINRKICVFLIILCIFYLFFNLISLSDIIFQYGFNLASVQRTLYENNTSKEGILNAISFLIINPSYLALTITIITNYILTKKNKNLFVLVLVMSVGRIITTGGRQAAIQIFLLIFMLLSFVNNKENEKKKIGVINVKKLALIILTFLVLLFLTLSRTAHVVKTIYLNFAMQPVMLEHWSNLIEQNGMYGYGFSSLMGFVYPIFYVLKNTLPFIDSIPVFISDIYAMNMNTMITWIKIGTNLSANAYVSIFWYLFYDFRIWGVIVGMLLLGMISYNYYAKAFQKKDLVNLSMYSYIVLCIFYSFGDMEFSKVNFVIAMLFSRFLLLKKKNEENYED